MKLCSEIPPPPHQPCSKHVQCAQAELACVCGYQECGASMTETLCWGNLSTPWWRVGQRGTLWREGGGGSKPSRTRRSGTCALFHTIASDYMTSPFPNGGEERASASLLSGSFGQKMVLLWFRVCISAAAWLLISLNPSALSLPSPDVTD